MVRYRLPNNDFSAYYASVGLSPIKATGPTQRKAIEIDLSDVSSRYSDDKVNSPTSHIIQAQFMSTELIWAEGKIR